MLLATSLVARAFDFSVTLQGNVSLYFTVTSDSTVKIVNPNWPDNGKPVGALAIPATVSDGNTTYHVTEIDRRAFAFCDGLTRVTIPEGVTTIGTLAFMACTSLDTVELPSSINSIANLAFNGCSFMSNIDNWVDSTVLYLGNYLIQVSSRVADTLTVPDGIEGIAGMAMYNCINLGSVVLPASLRFIGAKAFADCDTLQTVRLLGTTPPAIADDSFENVTDLTIIIPCGTVEEYMAEPLWAALTLQEDTCIQPEPGPNSIDIATGDVVSYTTTAKGIVVNNIHGTVHIYDLCGREIKSANAYGSVHITLPYLGIFVVRADGHAPQKVIYLR